MMHQYNVLIRTILDQGSRRLDRTGVGAVGIFNWQMEFDLRRAFPLVSQKETRWKVAFLEMLWFLRGEKNVKWLNDNGSKLWDAWADDHGRVGRIYGFQWRNWNNEGIDQISKMIDGLKNNEHGRRHIVSAWNVADLPYMSLPPCHWAHQCYVDHGWLDLKLFLRSSDVMLGLPFNIAQYALLTHLYGRATGLIPRRLIVDIGDAHIYNTHLEAARLVTDRIPEPQNPKLLISTENTDIDGYTMDDFHVVGYQPMPFIKLPVAV